MASSVVIPGRVWCIWMPCCFSSHCWHNIGKCHRLRLLRWLLVVHYNVDILSYTCLLTLCGSSFTLSIKTCVKLAWESAGWRTQYISHIPYFFSFSECFYCHISPPDKCNQHSAHSVLTVHLCASATVEKWHWRHSVFGSVHPWVSAWVSLCIPETLWRSTQALTQKPCEHHVSKTIKENFIWFWSQMSLGS